MIRKLHSIEVAAYHTHFRLFQFDRFILHRRRERCSVDGYRVVKQVWGEEYRWEGWGDVQKNCQ